MQPLLAVTLLTWKAAFRFRLIWLLVGLLLGSVVVLPLLLKDDGTARGFTQILLTYNLSVIALLLGLATLWLACGTLARDIEECQMQMVAVKPIARWQVWLGKWLGIVTLDLALLAVAGASVYTLLLWRSTRLPVEQQEVLRQEVFVARASLKEPLPDLAAATERILQERLKQTPVPPAQQPLVRREIREQLKAGTQVVPPGYLRRWTFDLGLQRAFLRNQPLFLRFKFHVAQTNASGTYVGLWQVGPPDSQQAGSVPMSLAADTFHEITIPAGVWVLDDTGKLTVEFVNRNATALLFPVEDGFEVLYREGGFGLNFARGLGVILCWLGLLAALGLAAASFLSFPVAAFLSFSLLFVALSTGTLSAVVSEGTVTGVDHETGARGAVWVDTLLLPVFRGILGVADLVKGHSPVDALSTGRSITWGELLQAFLKVVVGLGGVLAAFGMVMLTRRELATAPGTQ